MNPDYVDGIRRVLRRHFPDKANASFAMLYVKVNIYKTSKIEHTLPVGENGNMVNYFMGIISGEGHFE
jgi:hypothetical protein